MIDRLRQQSWWNALVHFAYFMVNGLIIISPALYNRYPLVYFDSGAYMEVAANLEPSFHRAFGYPLLIKLTGLMISNWPLIIVQGLVISFLLFQLIRAFFPGPLRYLWHFTAVMLLAFSTSLSWYAAQLMPDIWTLILVLSVLAMFFDRRASLPQFVLYCALSFAALLTHLSHLPLLFLIWASMFGIRWVWPWSRDWLSRKVILSLLVLQVATFISVSAFNASHKLGFRLSLASNVFITANLGEMGILQMYLDENCDRLSSDLCTIKDALPRETGGFLWDVNGPVQQHPGGWAGANEEYAPIVHDFLTKPRYLKWLIFGSVKSTVEQLFQIELGSGLQYAYGEGTPPYWPMKEHFKQELNEYLTSVQNKGDALPLNFFRWMNYISLFLSLLIIGRAIIQRQLSQELILMLVLVFMIYFYHAAITGVLANVYERLQCRVLPLIQFLAILVFYATRRSIHATEE